MNVLMMARMNACTTSTAITAEEKNEATKILTVDFMSSEETGQETAGSDNERVPPVTIFKLRPLPWRSDTEANSIIASMPSAGAQIVVPQVVFIYVCIIM